MLYSDILSFYLTSFFVFHGPYHSVFGSCVSLVTSWLWFQTFFLMRLTFFSFFLALVVKNLPANAGQVRDMDLIPGSGRSPGRGHGNPFQHSCLWTEEPGGLQSMGLHRVERDWSDLARIHGQILCRMFDVLPLIRLGLCVRPQRWRTIFITSYQRWYVLST